MARVIRQRYARRRSLAAVHAKQQVGAEEARETRPRRHYVAPAAVYATRYFGELRE